MDINVLFKLSYGMYIVGAFAEGRPVGCVVNTCFQVTNLDLLLVISLNKNNYTLEAIQQNKRFSLSVLAEDSDPRLIGTFGFLCSRTTDKYKDFGYDLVDHVPCVKGRFAGRIILEAEKFVDCGTHVLVIGRLVDTVPGEGTPMTYSYYHNVVKGKAPKNAPTYRADEDSAKDMKPVMNRYECDLCGYIVEVEGDLPADYICPICGADITHFHRIE